MMMQRARYSPVLRQAEITGQGQPDVHSFLQRKANMADHVRQSKSYPAGGGDLDQNLFIKTGELLIKEKKNRDYYERCFSSYNGLYYGDRSSEALARQYTFVGVATGDCEVGGENMYGTDPMDHGFGFLRAGSNTIVNNSEEDLYGGDIICWQFGKHTDDSKPKRLVDNGLNPWAAQNKEGTPLGKALIQIRRFDPMDFSMQVAGAFSLFDIPKSHPMKGISDLNLSDLLRPEKEKELTSLQEEALALKHGIAQIVMQGCLVLNRVQEFQVAVDTNNMNEMYETILNTPFLWKKILDRNIPNNQIAVDLNAAEQLLWAKDTINILYGGIFNAAYSKMSRCVGKVMRSSKAGNSVDVMFSHFKIWI